MRMLFKQRFFSWFDSYDIYDELGTVLYTVKGQLSWGHCLKIFDRSGRELGTVKQKLLTLLPQFDLYEGSRYLGSISKEFTFLSPRYHIDCKGWQVQGNFLEWDYKIVDAYGMEIATISKEVFRLTDTYTIDVPSPANAIYALMLVLAIDAEKCSR
ncbi:MAG: LURP-one-related family protein [Oscillospiraceae bacterium]|nr:LURP-one-related family protein [Oscillospiraceae bacterium]